MQYQIRAKKMHKFCYAISIAEVRKDAFWQLKNQLNYGKNDIKKNASVAYASMARKFLAWKRTCSSMKLAMK